MKNDMVWSFGWMTMIINDCSTDQAAALKLLGHLLNSLALVSSPNQHALVRTKVKANVSADMWNKLMKDCSDPPRQKEPEYQKPPVKDDPRFVKYFKMVRVGMPLEAAASQMAREGSAPDYDTAVKILNLDPLQPFPDKL